MFDDGPADPAVEIAAICSAFTTTPDVAARLRGREWRVTTVATMDAMRATQLKRDFDRKETKHWTSADHAFFKDLLYAGGYEQAPLTGSADGDGD